MTPAEAQALWASMQTEMHERLLAVRPKLKSYDAALLWEHARRIVVAKFAETQDAEALRAEAFGVFAKCRYVRGARFT